MRRRGARRLRALQVGALALIALGLGVVGYAFYLPVKALLGQRLLASAWEEGRSAPTPTLVKPWPWADIAPVARLDFPSLGESRLVLNEASGEAMAWGPGHVAGTQPLGRPGLSAAAAHRDTHFALLGKLGPGDPIELETLDGVHAAYRVVGARVVNAQEWRFPVVSDGPDMLALSTCWPLDSTVPGPERLILFAARVEPGEPDAKLTSRKESPGPRS